MAHATRPRRALPLCVVLLCLAGAGCVHKKHTTDFLRDDPELGEAFSQKAAELCLEHRGDGKLPDYPFTSDGCTSWPEGSWGVCCLEHDIAYWCGGPREERTMADRWLGACTARSAGKAMGYLMYLGVRTGGASWAPTSWRWGYGWKWPEDGDNVGATTEEVSGEVDTADSVVLAPTPE